MMIEMLYSKIHRAVVNEANLHYDGSISISKELMEAAGLHEYQKVMVVDINNGSRFSTYAITSDRINYICINGAAARLVHVHDLVIIMAFTYIEEIAAYQHKPKIIKVDENNRIINLITHI